jgi:transposase InsO family protein
LDFWIGLCEGIAFGVTIGCIIGALHTDRARRYWQWRLARKLQLIAQRNEMKGYRRKRRRPGLKNWRKCLLGWLHSITPTLTRYTNFKPATLVGWHRRFVKRWWWMLVVSGKRRAVGRPRIDASVEKIIIDIKAANPSYGTKRISFMVTQQLGVEVSQTTVRNILKRQQRQPSKPAAPKGQRWKDFLKNHRHVMASMDFKVTFDWRARPLYIFNVIDHHRRELVVCRATYNPNSDWVAQQIRDAYPFDEAPKMMLMDHDSIFIPVMNKTLPNMGIKVVRTSIGCPWLNGVVERFNRTLTEELLDCVIPQSALHINQLLRQYQAFYNTARPHLANDGQSPIQEVNAANDVAFTPGTLRVEAIPWLGGLHHSYRRAA